MYTIICLMSIQNVCILNTRRCDVMLTVAQWVTWVTSDRGPPPTDRTRRHNDIA